VFTYLLEGHSRMANHKPKHNQPVNTKNGVRASMKKIPNLSGSANRRTKPTKKVVRAGTLINYKKLVAGLLKVSKPVLEIINVSSRTNKNKFQKKRKNSKKRSRKTAIRRKIVLNQKKLSKIQKKVKKRYLLLLKTYSPRRKKKNARSNFKSKEKARTIPKKVHQSNKKQEHAILKRFFLKNKSVHGKSILKNKKSAVKRSKTIKRRTLIFGLQFVILIIGFCLGVFYTHRTDILALSNIVSVKSFGQTPGKITTPGPAQDNPLFSIYPTWSQDFTKYGSDKLDSTYWNINSGPAQNSNSEEQYYTDNASNLFIREGALTLTATHEKQPDNYEYASARVDTEGKQTFLYGRIDVTAKLPIGVGTWPAVWFLPANNKYQNLSPASDVMRYLNGGEIDLIEAVGFNPNVEYGVVHTQNTRYNQYGVGAFNEIKIENNHINYNTYSLLWTPTDITFAVNGVPFFTYNKTNGADYRTWPFDQPFYLIINLAMGGIWGGQDKAEFPGNGIDNNALPASMSIQTIYYYPYKSQL
jgi:beta-glucanase (GH16 family)